MTESQIQPLSESHLGLYQRLFEYTGPIRRNPTRLCVRSIDNIILRLHKDEKNCQDKSLIDVLQMHQNSFYYESSGEDETLHPFCFLECTSLQPRRLFRLSPEGDDEAEWPPADTLEYSRVYLRRQILPELIDLFEEWDKKARQRIYGLVGRRKDYEKRLRSYKLEAWLGNGPWKDYKLPQLCPATIEQAFTILTPDHLEEQYSLHYIMLRKFSGDHNMGHEEAHKVAHKRTSEQYWEWKNQTISEENMQLTSTEGDEATEPTTDLESESEDCMDIDEPESDEGVVWSPGSQMSGQEVYDEPQGQVQESKKRHFDDDDDDDDYANFYDRSKRARLMYW
ncbi:hypothetical protein FMUND_12694 [Fusarium mundagurra]|uniref:Uncharacterized protein n=1 Tax=Fusarium mundagurra TaxID=1567541 RepID=A0A8H5Y357_9HYPO|nr:hypothetical protein FMUND_12694 [Fusarium mundagurra]